MDYTLARQLKEAGFQQYGEGMPYSIDGKTNDYYPTLSELIEACGDEFEALGKSFPNNTWRAFTFKRPSDTDGIGKTPEEAVANLWLSLHKK